MQHRALVQGAEEVAVDMLLIGSPMTLMVKLIILGLAVGLTLLLRAVLFGQEKDWKAWTASAVLGALMAPLAWLLIVMVLAAMDH